MVLLRNDSECWVSINDNKTIAMTYQSPCPTHNKGAEHVFFSVMKL